MNANDYSGLIRRDAEQEREFACYREWTIHLSPPCVVAIANSSPAWAPLRLTT